MIEDSGQRTAGDTTEQSGASDGPEQCVVLGDVVGSREIEDRAAFKEALERSVSVVSDRYADALVAGIEPLKGLDEFGGVLVDVSVLYRVLRDVTEALHPTEVRFGVATGSIDVGRSTGSVSEMDGNAFHCADELVARAEGEGLLVAVDTGNPTLDPFLTVAFDSLLRLRGSWTDRQLEAVQAYRRAGTQGEAAETLGISQQAVSNALSRAGYDRVVALEAHVADGMEAAYDGS